jgi:hypothetical protein
MAAKFTRVTPTLIGACPVDIGGLLTLPGAVVFEPREAGEL